MAGKIEIPLVIFKIFGAKASSRFEDFCK